MDNAKHSNQETETDLRKSIGTLLGSASSLKTSKQPSLTGNHVTSLNMFSDAACGEPLTAQHLIIDFTPDDELDTKYVQKKCCAFWEFINSRPELNHMCVLPDKDANYSVKTPVESTETSNSQSCAEVVPEGMDRTAVSMLSLVEHKDLISRAFEPKLCQTHCTLGSREYMATETNKPVILRKCACARAAACHKPCKPGIVMLESDSVDAQVLCKSMEEWDTKHPKSMQPPGPTPGLIHAVLQRKIKPSY